MDEWMDLLDNCLDFTLIKVGILLSAFWIQPDRKPKERNEGSGFL